MSKSWPEIVPDVRIPVPPFRDLDESKTFHRALAVHVAEIGRASGGPFAETLALCSVIASAGALQRSASSGDGATGAPDHPSAVVLGVALLTRLPVAWTPVSLVEAVRASSSGEGMLWAEPTATQVGYFSDPEFSASRDAAGRWTAGFRERGVSRVDAVLDDDWTFVRYLMDHVADRFPFPFGWSTGGVEQDPLVRRNAAAVSDFFAAQRETPYLRRWSAAEA